MGKVRLREGVDLAGSPTEKRVGTLAPETRRCQECGRLLTRSHVSRRNQSVHVFRDLGASEDRSVAEILGGACHCVGGVGTGVFANYLFEPRIGLIAGVHTEDTTMP